MLHSEESKPVDQIDIANNLSQYVKFEEEEGKGKYKNDTNN